jgi:DNA-directed RNA polymerase beta' subunit
MIINFHKFSILEKKNPGEGGNAYRGKKIDQDSPSKSGIEYKKNMSYQKADTGKSSANSYLVFLAEAISAIDEMSGIVAVADPSILDDVNNKKTSLGSSLKPTLKSHEELWNGIVGIGKYIVTKTPVNSTADKVSIAYSEEVKELEKNLEDGDITKEEMEKKKDELLKSASDDMVKAKNVYYQQAKSALPYYEEAITAFKQGAILEIKNVDKEEVKGDDIKAEGDNYTNWLDQANAAALKLLYATKKS